jgi:hypothetical protein
MKRLFWERPDVVVIAEFALLRAVWRETQLITRTVVAKVKVRVVEAGSS